MKPKHSSVLDQIFKMLTAGAALLVLGLAGLILYQLIVQSWTSIKEFGLGFLTSDVWDPVFNEYGALPFIYGTVASSLIALLIAVPLSLGVAIFLSEIAPVRIRKIVGFFVEVLASIPSVIYGLWGVFVLIPLIRRVQPAVQSLLGFIPLFQGPPFGYSLIAAGIILAIMIIPTITSLSRDALNAVPNHQREASLALGATRWETIRRVVLPYNKSGIIAAVMLGLGRALGETMAVTMVIGNHPQINLSLFMPAQTMASLIANEFSEATDAIHLSALVEIGLILFLVTFTLNIIARLVIKPIKTKGVSR
jgi:phosphate transport system permease protein